ncbi:hypothetical protein MXB_2529 [Myxobolus squamalis]|nr:hypothetical protein MXB_2529 [Myxobolus squamalis]
MFRRNLPKAWPIPTDEIYSRLAYLHGIKAIVKKYPQHIGRLRQSFFTEYHGIARTSLRDIDQNRWAYV